MFLKYIKITYAEHLLNRSIQNYILHIYIQLESLFYNRNLIVGVLVLSSDIMPPLNNFHQFFKSFWGQADVL